MIFDKMSNNFKERLLFSSIGAIFALVLIYLSPYPYFRPLFAFFMATVTGSALWEYYRLAKKKRFQPLEFTGIVIGVAYIFSVFISTQEPRAAFLPYFTLWASLIIFFCYSFCLGDSPLGNIAVTLFGIGYLAIPLGCAIDIVYFYGAESPLDGRWWLLYLFLVSKSADVGAYICGKNFGYNKLAPVVSPKKTWEGAIGGLVLSLLISLGIYWTVQHFFVQPPLDISFWQSIWLGGLISLLAQIGDLAESLLKRDAGVKDSNQIPGLGGTLDVVDSLVFTLPLMYIFLILHSGVHL